MTDPDAQDAGGPHDHASAPGHGHASGSAMYRQEILDHYKNPENFGDLDPSSFQHDGENPLCGDTLSLAVRLGADGSIEQARFRGQGCAISQAATDILLSELTGKSTDEVLAFDQERLLALLGIEVSSLRIKCAILPLLTIQDGLRIHQGEMEPVDVTRTEA